MKAQKRNHFQGKKENRSKVRTSSSFAKTKTDGEAFMTDDPHKTGNLLIMSYDWL